MIQLCVPVTDIFRRNQDQLLPLVGAVSFKQPTDETFPGKEQMLECSLNISGSHFQEELRRDGLLAALQSGRYTSFACDLGPAWDSVTVGKSPNGYPRYLPQAGPKSEQEYLAQAQENVRVLRSHFSGKIKVEQLNYFPSGAYEMVCEPDFIARTLSQLEIELLLDMGHLTISAHNLGMSEDEYLDRLPLKRASEVQLSGSNIIGGIWEDTHEVPSARDLTILEGVLERSQFQYVTLEYYKQDQPLVQAYHQLHRLLGRANGSN